MGQIAEVTPLEQSRKGEEEMLEQSVIFAQGLLEQYGA